MRPNFEGTLAERYPATIARMAGWEFEMAYSDALAARDRLNTIIETLETNSDAGLVNLAFSVKDGARASGPAQSSVAGMIARLSTAYGILVTAQAISSDVG